MTVSKISLSSGLLEKYKTLLFESSIGLWEWNRFTDLIHCDSGLCRLYGVPLDEIQGPPLQWYSLIHPEDRAVIQDLMDSVWKNKAEIDSKFRIVLANGEIKFIRTKAIKVFDQNHQVAHLVGLNWDVTKESTLKVDLAKTKIFLENIIDSVPDPIFVKNEKHQWVFANQEFEKLLGKKKNEFVGKTDKDFFEDTLVDRYWEFDNLVFSSGKSVENEEMVPTPSGHYRDFLTKKTLLNHAGNDSLLIGIMRDVTEIKKIQKSLIEQSKLATMGEITAGMAHEINNPLSIISGKMMLLKSHLDSNKEVDKKNLFALTDSVIKNCHRIEKMVRSLNSFSRNSQSDPFENILIADLFTELKEIVSEKILSEKVTLSFQINESSLNPICVFGRSSELIQVLVNLLNNSMDAIREQSSRWIKIEISFKMHKVFIDVIDSGLGIRAEIADKIMDYFFTTKPSGQGTGLGLSLARQIIKSHGGTLDYLPSEKNTTFRIALDIVT